MRTLVDDPVGSKPDSVCKAHQMVLNLCKELREMDTYVAEGDIHRASNVSYKLNLITNYIETITIHANSMSQKMEDRLYAYRNAVEQLGFTRNKV